MVQKSQLVDQLIELFPEGDPAYFKSCLEHYNSNHVERIAEKIFSNHGHYPRVPASCANDPVKQLNYALRKLATEIFPDCNVRHLREKLLRHSHSHVEQVTEEMLAEPHWPERLEFGHMDPSDGIRSEKYKKQAYSQLIQDYPHAWKSSIRAVLAENNWDYLKSLDQLAEMGSDGFLTKLKRLFRHWALPAASSSSPLEGGSDPEFEHDLDVVRRRALDAQSTQDAKIAKKINQDEYADENQLITCDCCYGDYVFEDLCFCSEGEHVFCHTCMQKFLSEGLLGEGNLRGAARIPCIAMSGCNGCIPAQTLATAVTDDLWRVYEKSLFEESVMRACKTIIQCSGCGYCELDETTRPLSEVLDQLGGLVNTAKWFMVVESAKCVYYIAALLTCIACLFIWKFLIIVALIVLVLAQWDLKGDLTIAYERVASQRRGSVFRCRNPSCEKLTCLRCSRVIRGVHQCWEKERDGLRLYVEKAMADAVKRTCPVCNLSFQKADGCNKIVCHCGYTMCYVCRKEIRKESYAHFCDHFREIPGRPCDQCNKCDLYKTEPEDDAVQKAAATARKEYLRAHPDVSDQLTNTPIKIGPSSALEKFDEWRHAAILWVLEQGLSLIV